MVEATLSRFRPIMLTAISTVLGLIPIAPTVFWGPMAFAIMGGLFVATMLTLLVLPVFYITLYRAKRPGAEVALLTAPAHRPTLLAAGPSASAFRSRRTKIASALAAAFYLARSRSSFLAAATRASTNSLTRGDRCRLLG